MAIVTPRDLPDTLTDLSNNAILKEVYDPSSGTNKKMTQGTEDKRSLRVSKEITPVVFTTTGTFTPDPEKYERCVADTTGGTFDVTVGNGSYDGQKATLICDEDGTANATFIINWQSIPFSPGRKLDLQWNLAESKWDFEDVIVSQYFSTGQRITIFSGGVKEIRTGITYTFSSARQSGARIISFVIPIVALHGYSVSPMEGFGVTNTAVAGIQSFSLPNSFTIVGFNVTDTPLNANFVSYITVRGE